jgi:hypothetical protein
VRFFRNNEHEALMSAGLLQGIGRSERKELEERQLANSQKPLVWLQRLKAGVARFSLVRTQLGCAMPIPVQWL